MKKELSHIDNQGKAQMVDVGNKPEQTREATATGKIFLKSETLELLTQNLLKKGDVLTVAQIAGIQAAKKTSDLIPLCHPLMLNHIEVKAFPENDGVRVNALVKSSGKTGVEMEALTAVSMALLTVYDMCKAVEKTMVIGDIKVLDKKKY